MGTNLSVYERSLIATEDLDTTDGFLGSAWSHYRLWNYVVNLNQTILVLEDDAYTWQDIQTVTLPEHFDIVMCGCNVNSVSITTSPNNLTRITSYEPKYPSKEWILNSLSGIRSPTFRRLRRQFGISCYWISPAGASKLLATALPLRAETIHIPLLGNVQQFSLDTRMNALYDHLMAYVTYPWLSYTTNVESSTR